MGSPSSPRRPPRRCLGSFPIGAATFCLHPVAVVAAAATYFSWQEDWSAVDSLYFTASLLTTVGYGDVTPSTGGGKLVACTLALTAVTLVAEFAHSLIHGLVRAVDAILAAVAACVSSAARRRAAVASIGNGSPDARMVLLPTQRRWARLRALALLCAGWLLACCAIGRHVLHLEAWPDCAYFAVITATTVGFGDIVPADPASRAATALVMLVGTPLFGAALGGLVEELRDGADRPTSFATFRQEIKASGGRIAPESLVAREEALGFLLVRNGMANMGDVRSVLVELSRVDFGKPGAGPSDWSNLLSSIGPLGPSSSLKQV